MHHFCHLLGIPLAVRDAFILVQRRIDVDEIRLLDPALGAACRGHPIENLHRARNSTCYRHALRCPEPPPGPTVRAPLRGK